MNELPFVLNSMPVGSRVTLAADVERFPHFIAKKGSRGTVVDGGPDTFAVRLDEPLAGAEEWDNEVHWYVAEDSPFGEVVFVEPKQDPVAVADALALIRERFTRDADGYADCDLLHRIYEAMTGDSLPWPESLRD